MNHHILPAFATVLLVWVTGCANEFGGGPVPLPALESRPYHSNNGAGSSYRLKQDVVIKR